MRNSQLADDGGRADAPRPASGHDARLARRMFLHQQLARRVVLRQGRRVAFGAITIVEGTDLHEFSGNLAELPLRVRVQVHDPRFWPAVAFGGTIGVAEAFMHGYWTTDDLTGLVRFFVRNRKLLDGMETGWARLAEPLNKFLHWLCRNTRTSSRKNVSAHYDLGNGFFSQFLDETMTYSSAIFERDDSTLFEASVAKNDRICHKLQLGSSDHVLEIGSGWGGFAIHAASRYGCRVTAATISREQYDWATTRVREAGLADRIDIVLCDYRDLGGQFDKIVSIEMIEAVGHEYLHDYFRICSRLLKPNGMMLVQAITIADQFYERARRSVDFIQRYIFPGGGLPSVSILCGALARVTDMRLFHLEDLTPHYARTLQEWRRRFLANLETVRSMGYPEAFVRMWEFYLCYCEGGFRERSIANVQMLLTKPLCRRDSILPQVG